MALTIELAPDKEKALRREAARRGVPVAEYARALLEERLPDAAAAGEGDPGDRSATFREWAASHNLDNPLLAEESLRHEGA